MEHLTDTAVIRRSIRRSSTRSSRFSNPYSRRRINCNPVKFWVAMNAVYSDLSEVAERHGVGNDEFYADMAKSFWLCDKDAVEDKLAAYYENVVKHN